MNLFFVDASVGVKWFVPEIQSDAAKRLQDSSHELHAPSLFDVELAGVPLLCKVDPDVQWRDFVHWTRRGG